MFIQHTIAYHSNDEKVLKRFLFIIIEDHEHGGSADLRNQFWVRKASYYQTLGTIYGFSGL